MAVGRRIVVPHRVVAPGNDLFDRREIESLALRQKNKVRLEAPGMQQRPTLGEAATDQSFGPFIVDQSGGMSCTAQRALDALFHPPPLGAADDQNLDRKSVV